MVPLQPKMSDTEKRKRKRWEDREIGEENSTELDRFLYATNLDLIQRKCQHRVKFIRIGDFHRVIVQYLDWKTSKRLNYKK